ncbi:hypothetical protein FS837_008335 [Tulasnella sp. UAMH 9824]|nr:hypothetical protein FS837_008335 [Tulasnella sp. UAMH 9824]
MATASRPQVKKQTSVAHRVDMPVYVSAGTAPDFIRLAARCAPVPGLAPAAEALQKIHGSVQRVSWNKGRCYNLSTQAKSLLSVICDDYENERSEARQLQNSIERTVDILLDIARDLGEWAALSFWKSWYLRHEINVKIDDHEEQLERLTESISLATARRLHDQVWNLQQALKNPAISEDRKRAEEQLFRLRSAPAGEVSGGTAAELVGECVRLGSQPEYSGPRNDIWKGRWLDKEDVALIFNKEHKAGMRDHDSIRRFERQIKIWRTLENPFVLRLYGWCKFDGETYLVSPWLRNGGVLRYLDGDGNRDQQCIRIIGDIARGLNYLHNQDIFHGSLKPSNVLINDAGRAVLSDFSLAKIATADARNSQEFTQVNIFRYQSPEVISDEPISKASDVYSWAMTALEIITGNPPFHTLRSPGQLITYVVMKNQIPARGDYKSPVLENHPEIWELFVKCWSRDPKDRPTATEIVKAIDQISSKE